MHLNAESCRSVFFRKKPLQAEYAISGKPLDTVPSHKVLGLTLQFDLKWVADTNATISKVSKHLYILRVLKWFGLPTSVLLSVEQLPFALFLKFRASCGTSPSQDTSVTG